jgi:hypothetical protein
MLAFHYLVVQRFAIALKDTGGTFSLDFSSDLLQQNQDKIFLSKIIKH